MGQRDKNKVYCFVDTPVPLRLNLREYAIKGWFLPQADLAHVQRLKIRVDAADSDVFVGLPRPDVADHFNDPDAANSGFVARFKAPKTDSSIALVAQTGGQQIILHQIQAGFPSDPTENRKRTADNYLEWITRYESDLFWPEDQVDQRVSQFSPIPLISVIVAADNAHPYYLERCIGSVLRQHYAHLELCISASCSTHNQAREYLRAVACDDPRVRVIELGDLSGISNGYNHTLMAAQGDICVFLNENDELHPFALLEIARHLDANPEAELIYSDEDSIDFLGVRSRPVFKSDFDIDAFLSFNYLGRLMAVKRELALHVRGFRSACDIAQDWDFILRCVEHVGYARVQHIRKPLYHRRIEGLPAIKTSADRNAFRRSISGHVERTGRLARVEDGLFEGSVRLRYHYPKDLKVGVFLRAEDGAFQTTVLSPNLSAHTVAVYELIDCVVRRADISFAKEASEPASNVVAPPLVSLDDVNVDVFIFINAPLETVNHFLVGELVSQAMREDCGLVSGISVNANNHVLHSGYVCGNKGELLDLFVGQAFPSVGYLSQMEIVRAVESISHHFFAVRREHLAAIGGLGCVSASRMPHLVSKLVENAAKQKLRVLVTPYAVATFDGARSAVPEGCRPGSERISANPNLAAFSNLQSLYKAREELPVDTENESPVSMRSGITKN